MEVTTANSSLLMAASTLLLVLSGFACGSGLEKGAGSVPRTITVAQSGPADVAGTDSVALQKAADLLRPGDTLVVGEGTYTMDTGLYLPSDITLRGVAGKTILLKSAGVESMLEEDGDFGERELFVAEPSKFRPGMGITLFDDVLRSGWDISTTTITSVEGNRLVIDSRTERDYNLADNNARVKNTFPILCVVDGENVVIEDMIVDGNRAENDYIDGCRGGAIYLYRVRNITVRNCVARNYNGDGISFQITEGVRVLNCESHGHSGYGVHPGTGSAGAIVTSNHLHDNGDVGLFLCWRVRNGRFSENVIENNGHYGISIGHKDTDNLFVNNKIMRNGHSGVFFRRETFKNSGHRNTFRDNIIEDNGDTKAGYGFYIQPLAGDIVIENNRIAETRSEKGTQRFGVYKVTGAGEVTLSKNTMVGNLVREYAEGPGDSR